MEHNINTWTISPYLEMLNSKLRNSFYQAAIAKSAKDKVVLDVGTGTGLLSAYALAAGAKFVYAVEANPASARIANEVLSSIYPSDAFKVITANFHDARIIGQYIQDSSVDVFVSELFGPNLFDQCIVNIWQSAKRYMKPSTIYIPDTLGVDLLFHSRSLVHEEYGVVKQDSVIDTAFYNAITAYDAKSKNVRYLHASKLDNVVGSTQDTLVVHPDSPVADIIIDVPTNISAISMSNYIAFEDQRLYIKECDPLPWQYVPIFDVAKPGQYKISWNNTYNMLDDSSWTMNWLER